MNAVRDQERLLRPKKAEFASQLLTGSKVQEAIWLLVSDKDSPRSTEERESYDACGDGTHRASSSEHNRSQDCCS